MTQRPWCFAPAKTIVEAVFEGLGPGTWTALFNARRFDGTRTTPGCLQYLAQPDAQED